MVTKASGLLPVSEVAKRYGISNQQVLRAIRAKRLRAYKIGWMWAIRERDLPDSWSDLPS